MPRTKSVILAVLMVASTGALGDNLLINGGFETGDFTGWNVTSRGSGVNGVGMAGQLIPGTNSQFGDMYIASHSGSFAAFGLVCAMGPCYPSGANTDSLTLSQTVSVVSGTTYIIRFWVGTSAPSVSSNILFGNYPSVYLNGRLLDTGETYVPINGFVQVSTSFIATSSAANLSFYLTGSGYGDAGFSYDDFSLQNAGPVVPEPASMLLMAAGFLVLVIFSRIKSDRSGEKLATL